MTTNFKSERSAKFHALCLLESHVEIDELKSKEQSTINQFGNKIQGNKYSAMNSNGDVVDFVIVKNFDDFNVWFILPNGICFRA